METLDDVKRETGTHHLRDGDIAGAENDGIRRRRHRQHEGAGRFVSGSEDPLGSREARKPGAFSGAIHWDNKQVGTLDLSPEHLGLAHECSLRLIDQFAHAPKEYLWKGTNPYLELDPRICPAHIFQIVD